MKATRLRAVCVVALAGTACDGSPNAGKTVDDLATAVCDLTFRCCERGEVDFFLGPFVDATNCEERIRRQAELDTTSTIAAPFEGAAVFVPNIGVLQNAIDDGRVEINADALDACLDFLGGLSCNELIEEPEPEGCQPPEPPEEPLCDIELLVTGTVGDGGTCTSPGFSFECKPGLACRAIDSLGIDGVCVEPGAEGDFCFGSDECGEDLYCSLLDGTCQAPRQAGETCLVSDGGGVLIACAEDLSCDPVTDTCVARCERGSVCFDDDDCDVEAGLQCIVGRCDSTRGVGLPCQISEHCTEGLRCGLNPATGTDLVCLEKIPTGQTCSTAQPDHCQTGFCDPATSLCAAASDPGQTCPSLLHEQCAGGYCEDSPRLTFCDENADCVDTSGVCNLDLARCEAFCIALQPDGAACVNGFECQSETCVGGFCRTTPLADGQPCNTSDECASEFCNHETPSVCEALPLPNGRVCFLDQECASGVCHQGSCQTGLSEGADCSSSDPFGIDPPCARNLFCDRELQPPLCVPALAAGEECFSSDQCLGACTQKFNRRMCDATPAEGAAACDGVEQ